MIFPQRCAALNVSRSHGRVCPPRPPLLLRTPVACDGCWVVNIWRWEAQRGRCPGRGFWFHVRTGQGSGSSMSILATWPRFPQSLQLSQLLGRGRLCCFVVCLFVCELLQVLPSCGTWVVHDGSFYVTLLMIWVSCSVETNLYRCVSRLHFRSNPLILTGWEDCYNLLHLKL